MSVDFSELNTNQKAAVDITDGPLLVLAGAGSGKTKVLTYRIANIIDKCLCRPWNILAITFTNKAAQEMRTRINALIGDEAKGMWILTFHSMCVKILRSNAELLGFGTNFTIYDDSDSKRLIKTICADLNIDVKIFSINMIRWQISAAKNDLLSPQDCDNAAMDPANQAVADVYAEYQKRLKAANAFDFDDLLMYTYYLLKQHPDVLNLYQSRFLYISVDEYQDTNKAQYEITKLLAGQRANLMVVGDDDQSIYSWRGADVTNILGFEKDFPQTQTVKLEQNYRSTSTILDAANSVISNNNYRKNKHLFTKGDKGEKIGVYVASNERDEGRWIASELERRRMRGAKLEDMAVFYRTNAQSRVLEDMLIRAGIPYKIVGGLKFFERAEIKDIMAYLSLLINPSDDVSAMRIINVPRRGIGKTTIEYICDIQRLEDCSFFHACRLLIDDDNLRPSVKQSLKEFVDCVMQAKKIEDGDTHAENMRQRIETYIKNTGLINSLRAEKSIEADSRIDNINEFFGVVDEFIQTHKDDELMFDAPSFDNASIVDEDKKPLRQLSGDNLADFLEWVRLRTDLDTLGAIGDSDKSENRQDDDATTLMTIHSAKGLEFDYVFVAGMEEGVFPHASSFGDFEETEEERRLAYVAITRARKELLFSCAQTRQLRGVTNANPISRFIGEIPNELKKSYGVGSLEYSGFGWDKRGDRRGIAGSGSSKASASTGHIDFFAGKQQIEVKGKLVKEASNQSFSPGDKIDHKVFGEGQVKSVDGDTLKVYFINSGTTKTLMKDFAPIVKID